MPMEVHIIAVTEEDLLIDDYREMTQEEYESLLRGLAVVFGGATHEEFDGHEIWTFSRPSITVIIEVGW